ncbi:MAG TPA: acetyl-CoA carboxylase biotin carboxyl carrier protein [Polyangia bacterium]
MRKMRPKAVAAPRRAALKTAPPVAAASPEAGGESAGVDLRLIRELAQLINEQQLAEVELERGGDRVRLRRGLEPAAAVHAAPASLPAVAAPAPAAGPPAPAAPPADDPSVVYVTSPFVGTFYRAPSPDSAPYVETGARVHKGQTLCIVEAMKLMNEIESEIEGTILEILGTNGQPVEYGERLFKMKTG